RQCIPQRDDSPCASDAVTVYGLKEANAKGTLPRGIFRTLEGVMITHQAPQHQPVDGIENDNNHQGYPYRAPNIDRISRWYIEEYPGEPTPSWALLTEFAVSRYQLGTMLVSA